MSAAFRVGSGYAALAGWLRLGLTGAYYPPLMIPSERASEVALEQVISGEGLDWGVDITESDDR